MILFDEVGHFVMRHRLMGIVTNEIYSVLAILRLLNNIAYSCGPPRVTANFGPH